MRQALSLLHPLRVLASLPALLLMLGLMLLPVQPGERQGLEPPLALSIAEALAEALPRKPGAPTEPASEPTGDNLDTALPASTLGAQAQAEAGTCPETTRRVPNARDLAHAPRAPPALPV